MEWISKNGHCSSHCKNLTNACYCCEEHDDCDCELVAKCSKCDKKADYIIAGSKDYDALCLEHHKEISKDVFLLSDDYGDIQIKTDMQEKQ